MVARWSPSPAFAGRCGAFGSCCSACAQGRACEGGATWGASATATANITPEQLVEAARGAAAFTPLAPFLPFLPGAPSSSAPAPASSSAPPLHDEPSAADQARFRELDARWSRIDQDAAQLPAVRTAMESSWLPFRTAWRNGHGDASELDHQAAQLAEVERIAKVARLRVRREKTRGKVLVGGLVGLGLVGLGLAARAIL